MMMEVWKSNKGDEELHHFLDAPGHIYLFGFNRKLLGEDTYQQVREIVEHKLEQLGRT